MRRSTLQDLTRNPWTLIESEAKRISLKLGQEIIKEGARVDHLYILRCRSASVELEGTTARAVIATLSAGDVCGEMAFLGDSTATAAVVAKDEVAFAPEIEDAMGRGRYLGRGVHREGNPKGMRRSTGP